MHFLKNFLGGFPAFYVLIFFGHVLNYKIEKTNKLNSIQMFLIKKLFRLGYEVEFKRLRFLQAYRYRLYESINVIEGRVKADRNLHQNYINFIQDNEIYNFLKSDKNLIQRLKKIKTKDTKKIPSANVYEYKNILYLGPKTNLSEKNMSKYDLVITNKLLPDEVMKKINKTFLITGNLWLRSNSENLKKIKEKYENLSIFSTYQSDISILPSSFNELPEFPHSTSLMNLQRTLFFIASEISFSKLEIDGFDLFTSKTKKNEWYNKQAIKLIDNERENFIYSLMRHDYLLNLMFTKSILKDMSNIEGNFLSFLNNRNIVFFFNSFRDNI